MNLTRYLPVGAALVLIVAAAIVQGTWTERWGEFPELALYASQLKNVRLQIGDWTGEDQEDSDTDRKVLELAGAVGSLSRTYRNERNEQVSIFIVCGRLDDVFFHTPDRCYPAAGFETNGDVTQQSIETGSGVADFKTAMFLKADPGGNQNLRVYWTFNANGEWVAPAEHRWSFAGQRAMYKVYVVSPITGRESAVDKNPAVDFIQVLIPELNKAIEPAFQEGRRMSGASNRPVSKVKAEKS